MIKLSIIVPVYNCENTIGRCIESILNQTFNDFELILVNDGSADRSEEKCREYAAKDYRISLYTKTNGGVSSARNLGMCKAKGEYITFVDADDYLCSDCYQNVNDESKNNDIIFYHYSTEKRGNQTKIYNRHLKEMEQNPGNLMLLYEKSKGKIDGNVFIDESISIFVWRVWFKTKYLNFHKIIFDERLKYGEDRIFLQEALVHHPKVKVCDEVFGYVHIIDEGESLTSLKNIKDYNPWLYEQQKNMDMAEMEVCRKSELLTTKDLYKIRMKRASAMRYLIIINEFKYNKNDAKKNIRKYYKDEFFRWSYNFHNFLYVLKTRNFKEIIKFLLIKCRFYKLLECIYSNLD